MVKIHIDFLFKIFFSCFFIHSKKINNSYNEIDVVLKIITFTFYKNRLMSIIDIIIILPIIWGLYKGFTKGLIVEIASLVALLLGIWGAMKFYKFTENIIEQNIDGFESYLPIIAFSITFIGIVVGIHLLAKIIDKLIKAVALGIINRIAGAVFGGLKFLLIISAFLVIIDKIDSQTHLLEDNTKNESLLYKPVLSITYGIFPSLKNITPDINTNFTITN